jgi:alkylhydroperoxidase/carboxymuconolactone decarboxylase family protein YurZ
MTAGDPTHERGMEVRREVLGGEHVDAAAERTTPFTADFQDLITRYAWGEIWTRPGLDRKTRSCITLTALLARGQLEELALHVRAAIRNGLTEDEIKEVLLHGATTAGCRPPTRPSPSPSACSPSAPEAKRRQGTNANEGPV